MTILLDTHTLLWFVNGDDQLSSTARQHIENPENIRLLSVGSLWEMAIKVQIGKLRVPLPFTHFVSEHVHGNQIDILPIRPADLDQQLDLSLHHRDPFDRLLIAQAMVEDVPVVGKDKQFEAYEVDLLW